MIKIEGKTLIITDPCYISNKGYKNGYTDYSPYICEDTLYGDWSCNVYRGTKEEVKRIAQEWNNFYLPFFAKYNSEYISQEERDKLYEEFKKKKEEFNKKYCLGSFCADAGMVAVYDADKIPEEKLKWCKEHPWCACIIENYTGSLKYEIEEEIDEDGRGHRSAHIVGDNFYSSQSGF